MECSMRQRSNSFSMALFSFTLLYIIYTRVYYPTLVDTAVHFVSIHPSILQTSDGKSPSAMLHSSSRGVRERFSSSRHPLFLILMLAGDVESNPGPRVPKYPCGMCSKAVKQSDKAVCCDICDQWLHNKCSGVSEHMYAILQGSDCEWICPNCGMPNFSASFFESDTG